VIGRGGLMVSVPDCGVTGPRFESHSCVYHDGHCDIQSWAWAVHL